MGLRTGESHPAHQSHDAYYSNMRRDSNDILLIENVTEYSSQTVAENLGEAYSCFDVKLDPRNFGMRTARARRYVIALKKGSVTWNPRISLLDVLRALRRQPIMNPLEFFFLKLPKTVLTSPQVTWFH